MRTYPIGSEPHFGPTMPRVQNSFRRLSSGKRINRAADDAAGLAQAEKLASEMVSLRQASRNVEHGRLLANTADGALASQGDALTRMRELAMQAASVTTSDSDRQAIQAEMQGLRAEIDRVSGSTVFNGQALLSGEPINIQAGTGGDSNDVISIQTPDVSAAGLGIGAIDLGSAGGAQDALSAIDSAIARISEGRGTLGASMNRFDATSNNLATSVENTAASLSQVADANIGAETYALSRDSAQLKLGLRVQKQSSMLKGILLDALG